MQNMCTSYIIFKCFFAQVVAFSNSTTCELQGQKKKKILLPCIFTGNTWIYHQMVMFLLKASYFPSFKKKTLLHSLRFRECQACESQRAGRRLWSTVLRTGHANCHQERLHSQQLWLPADLQKTWPGSTPSCIGKGLMRPHGSLRD